MARVQSIERAFRVLDAVSNTDLGITELASRVGMPKSTVARIVNTLVELEALERVPEEPTYQIGPKVYGLAAGQSMVADLIYRSLPHLRMLARELGEDAGLSVPDGNRVHYVAQEDAENNIAVRDWTGTLIPLHVVPSGNVILAHWPLEQVQSYIESGLMPYTSRTVTDPQMMLRRLKQVREQGHAWGMEEFAEGISSVAAPIYDNQSRVLGVIHVHGPSYRFPGDADMRAIAAVVIEAAARVSKRLR